MLRLVVAWLVGVAAALIIGVGLWHLRPVVPFSRYGGRRLQRRHYCYRSRHIATISPANGRHYWDRCRAIARLAVVATAAAALPLIGTVASLLRATHTACTFAALAVGSGAMAVTMRRYDRNHD